jgi:hypothetical protein
VTKNTEAYQPPEDRDGLLARYAKGERDFPETELSGADLSGVTLDGCIFEEQSWFSDTNFEGASLRGVSFRQCNVKCANFRKAEASGVFRRGSGWALLLLSSADRGLTALKRRDQGPRRRESKPGRVQRASPVAPPKTQVIPHPVFGAIPLVSTSWRDAAGNEQTSQAHDPSYCPPMPKGAVRGDVTRQHFCPMCHVPRYFYVDMERTCVQCGGKFVFSGGEQKFWYETLQFHFDSVATRCPECRRKRRSDKAMQQQSPSETCANAGRSS